MSIGDRLKQARIQRGLTQDAAAAALEVTKGSISAWETGRNHPLLTQFASICSLYRCSADDLLSGERRPQGLYGVRELGEAYDTKRAQQQRERALLAHFRALSPHLQEALIDLLAARNT